MSLLNRKQLPMIGYLDHLKIDLEVLLSHLRGHNLLDWSRYTDIQVSSDSKHKDFVVANEYCKTSFFTEESAPLMEGDQYVQLYLTDFDPTKASNDVALEQTNIFQRTKRLNPESSRYLPEADERNYGVRNHLVEGPLEAILDSFQAKITRVRLACLKPGFEIKPHVDYDPRYIVRYHIPIITNDRVIMGMQRDGQDHKFHLPADGRVYFFNSGLKHWVKNASLEARLHLIVDVHGQDDLKHLVEIPT